MAVPKFEDFLYPFLIRLKDNELTKKNMTESLIAQFNLTEEDCSLLTKSGKSYQIDDRIGWVRQYLRRAKFLDLPRRGVYKITQRGLDYLNTHDSLRIKDLLAYKEFADFFYQTVGSTVTTNITTSKVDDTEIITPTEQLDQAYNTISSDLTEELLQEIISHTSKSFEKLVVDLLMKMGYGVESEVTSYSHDGGIDGIIYEDKLKLDAIYIQAKKYAEGNKVSAPQVQQFAGALATQKANKGVFITTSSYTSGAIECAKAIKPKIVLMDGKSLVRNMIAHNVGVSLEKVYEIKKIDLNYFDD